LDYWLWGDLKRRVYAPPKPTTINELKAKIANEMNDLSLDTRCAALADFNRRLHLIIENSGAHIE
jgi:hypothetical protein